MHLEEHGLGEQRNSGANGRIKALEMADHSNAGSALRQADELVGLGQRWCERLLDEHVYARFHQLASDVQVLNGWNSDRSRFGLRIAQQLINAGEGACAK